MLFNLFLSLLPLVSPARIIYNGMHASSSHIGSMLPVAIRMVNDGHEVHFLESNSKNTSFKYPSKITNTYCQLPESIILQKVIIPAMWFHTYKPWDFPRVWTSGDKALVDMYTLHKDKLMDVLGTNWDLAIGDELFAVASYAIVLKTKEKGAPFIMMATCVQMNPMRTHLAVDGNLLHRPSMFIQEKEVFDVTSFISRLKTFTHAGIIYPGIWYYTSFVAVEGLKLLGYDSFRLGRLGREASFYFIDEMNPLAWPASTGNEILHVGYYCPENKGEPLPEDYIEFLEDSKSKGTILIAFGTNVMWEMAPDNIVQAFLEAINRLKDYRFVFAFNGKMEQLGSIGSNCKVTNWAPQKEILNHNKTVAFVSHGGLKSMKDTVCGTVPAVYMPMFAEQSHNSEMARQMGFGEIINKYEITADLLVEAILNIAENSKYKKNAIRIKGFMLDRPASSQELVSWATRRSLKHKDRYPTFKRKGMYLNWLQYYFMDLAFVLSVLAVLISY